MTARALFPQDQTSLSSRLSVAWAFTLLVSLALCPSDVWAAANTIGAIFCNVKNSHLWPFVKLYNVLAYIVAAVLAIKGCMLLVKHASGGESQVVKATAHLVGAGVLASLPKAIGTLQKTLNVSGGGTGGACEATAGGKATELTKMIQQFVENIYSPMFSLISAIAMVMGVFLIFRGLLKGAKTGSDPKESAPHAVAANLIVGAILVSIGGMIPSMMQTIFGTDTVTTVKTFALDWSQVTDGDTGEADKTIRSILMFVQVVGAISFLRGWLILRKAVEGGGQATVPQGLTHIIGGTMAINIVGMLTIIDKTFGTGLIK